MVEKQKIVYTALALSLVLNTALIPLSIVNNHPNVTDALPIVNLSYTSSLPVNATCTRNETQIRADLGGDIWVHKCDNSIYDIRQFLNGKATIKGINLNTNQWINLQKLNI